MALSADFPFLCIGEVVQHRKTGMVGKVTGFAHPSTDIMVGETGPYPQVDFVRLVPEGQSLDDEEEMGFDRCHGGRGR